MADAADLKSAAREGIRVRISAPAPRLQHGHPPQGVKSGPGRARGPQCRDTGGPAPDAGVGYRVPPDRPQHYAAVAPELRSATVTAMDRALGGAS
jgi:hypothetical protein